METTDDGGELSEKILSTLTFDELRNQCIRIMKFTDQELAEKFPEEKSAPDLIRKKYQHILETVTETDFTDLRQLHFCKRLKDEGNQLISARKLPEALQKYQQAVTEARKVVTARVSLPLMQILRLNLAHVYNQLGQHDKAIAECEAVIKNDPYNVKALYRIAAAYNAKGDSAKATEYVKRIRVNRYTDPQIVKLYDQLYARKMERLSDKQRDEIVNRVLAHTAGKSEERKMEKPRETWEVLSDEFMGHGLFVPAEEAKSFSQSQLTREALRKKIREVDTRRRFRQFMEYPQVDTLVEDSELLNEMERCLQDPENEFTKKICTHFHELSLAEVKNSIKGLRYRAKWVKVWKLITSPKFVFAIVGFIVFVVAAVLAYSWYIKSRPKGKYV